jgi:hypothetical protein
MSRTAPELIAGRDGKVVWGRKDEEYVADFCLVSRRTLDESEYKLFKYHFLLGADWKLCTRKLKIDRGSFFHEVYRIEQKLGRVFRELEPYSLFPVDEYFRGARRAPEPPRVFRVPEPKLGLRIPPMVLRPPLLAKIA